MPATRERSPSNPCSAVPSPPSPILRLILLAVSVCAHFLAPFQGAAQRSLEIQSFDVTVEVQEDGDIQVMESIRIRFNGAWNGFYRTIPVEYRTPQGFSYRLFLDVEGVTDEGGRELEREISREGPYRKVKIWVPDAVDATRTLTLRYSSPNALRFFEEHDELYWNVTGTEWDVPIRSASALIQLPEGASGLRASAFTGAYGSTAQNARVEEIESGFYFETTRGLDFREGLTVVAGWATHAHYDHVLWHPRFGAARRYATPETARRELDAVGNLQLVDERLAADESFRIFIELTNNSIERLSARG